MSEFKLNNPIVLDTNTFQHNKLMKGKFRHEIKLDGYSFKVKQFKNGDNVFGYLLIPVDGEHGSSEQLKRSISEVDTFLKRKLDESKLSTERINIYLSNVLVPADVKHTLIDGTTITVKEGRAYVSISQKGKFVVRLKLSTYHPFSLY